MTIIFGSHSKKLTTYFLNNEQNRSSELINSWSFIIVSQKYSCNAFSPRKHCSKFTHASSYIIYPKPDNLKMHGARPNQKCYPA